MRKNYKIEVDCAACAMRMEDAIEKLSGVKSASVNFMTQRMTLELEDTCDPEDVMLSVIKCCKKIERGFKIRL